MSLPPSPSSADNCNRPKRGTLVLTVLAGILVIGLAWVLILNAHRQPEPRIVREMESFHLRFDEGLEHLCREKESTNGLSMKFVDAGEGSDPKSVFRRDRIWTVPSEVLPAGDLSAFARVVLDGWKAREAYPGRGQGGGGSRFDFSFGDPQSHAQVLLTALVENGTTTIHSQTVAIEIPSDDESGKATERVGSPASPEALDRLRSLLISELERLCTLYTVPSKNPRERHRYRFDRPGDGYTGATIREHSWRWTVPGEVLEVNDLRPFADKISATWDPASKASHGEDHTYSISFGDGERQAFVSIIAVPGRASVRGGFSETIIHYRQLFFDGRHRGNKPTRGSAKQSQPLDLEALIQVPGSTSRELAANAKLDGDGRMLRSLREKARTSVGTWKIKYNLRFTLPPSEADIESFATSRDMTWEMKSTPESARREKYYYLRFFKIMEFSESTVKETTSAVRQFSTDHVGQYIGWGFSSHQITRRESTDRE